MTNDELASTHWATLKKMAEEAGGTYESKAQAIAFLSDKPATEPSADPAPVAAKPAAKAGPAAMLDKSKDFGQVFGEVEGFPSAVFFQAGAYFNAVGQKL